MNNPLLDPAARLVIGHRGASAEAPENTLPAFALALAQGADALELDVHATADGVPVVIHDATLDRTTDRRGAVAGLRWEEVRDARVPSLAEVLDAFPRTPLLIEIKASAATAPLAQVIHRHDAVARVAVAAFDAAALHGLAATGIAIGASRRDARRLVLAAYLGVRAGSGPRFYAIPDRYRGMPVPTRRVVATARRLGRPVHVWTVDDPARAVALWRRGVCGIISNRPGAMHSARERVATAGTRSYVEDP